MSFLFTIFAFILTIAILVTFHEFGHFWVARKLGVKVLRFSIGFGKPLWRWHGKDGVEYVIAALPLGGYVKMLDAREVKVADEEMSQEFNSQPLAARTAIVAAGPAFNFILAVILYFIMFIIGISAMRPIVGPITPNSIAANAGMRAGDEIVMVGGKEVLTWQEAVLEIMSVGQDNAKLRLMVQDESQIGRTVFLDTRSVNLFGDNIGIGSLGFDLAQPVLKPILGLVVADGGAQRSGLIPGDRVVSFAGQSLETWHDLVQQIRQYPDQTVAAVIERNGQQRDFSVQIDSVVKDGKRIGQLGVQVQADSAVTARYQIHQRYDPLQSLMLAATKTWDMSWLTLKIIWRLLTGKASVNNIGGPIAIAQFASASLTAGIAIYLGVLALLSISLGVLNLLPVPMLDGGHLLYYLIEFIKGSPVSETAQFIGTKIGIFLIAWLMIFALYNDLYRFFS